MRRPLLALAASLLLADAAEAVTIVLPDAPRPRIRIQIGGPGGGIDVVTFTVPAANVGDGTLVTNPTPVEVRVEFRAAPPNSRTAVLTADSSTPLSNGVDTIPFTTISWTASDPDIPSGTFNGGVQTLMTFVNSRRVTSFHTFTYANDVVVSSGTYTGRVTYTLTAP